MRVLLTGATGFVGRAALVALARSEPALDVRALARKLPSDIDGAVEWLAGGDLAAQPDLTAALRDVDVVVHAASRAHVMYETERDLLAVLRRVNRDATLHLAREAARHGARRFVFLSSIKVNGEGTVPGRAFRPDDAPAPVDPYALAKHEAESSLRGLAASAGMEVVIVRPPLVYGPGVKGNFLSLMRTLDRQLPLPLGAIDNRRSLVALGNLVDLLVTCVVHPAAAGKTFLVSDGEDLSTTELLRRTAQALGRRARLLPVPAWLVRAGATALGKGAVARRLCDWLQVDISATRNTLGWSPPVTVDDQLLETARYFREARAS